MSGLNKSKWKIEVRNGERFYASGPNSGKKVGSIRNSGTKSSLDGDKQEVIEVSKDWKDLSLKQKIEIYLDHNPKISKEIDTLQSNLKNKIQEFLLTKQTSGTPESIERLGNSIEDMKNQLKDKLQRISWDAYRKDPSKIKKGSDSMFYVAVVPVYMGKVLIGKRLEDGIWTTPAGGGKKGENPLDTAVREMHEEAGIDVLREKLQFLKETKAPNGKKVYCYLYNMDSEILTETHGEPPTFTNLDLDNEVGGWNWTLPENLPHEMKNPNNVNRLETINEALIKYKNLLEETVYMPVEMVLKSLKEKLKLGQTLMQRLKK